MVIVDVSDPTDDPAGSSFKIPVGEFLTGLGVGIRITGYDGYSVYKGVGNTNLADVEAGDRIEGIGAFFTGDYIIAVCSSTTPAGDGDFNTPLFRAASI